MSFSTPRLDHQRTRSRLTIGIPHYNSTVEEKYHLGGLSTRPWFLPVSIPIPGAPKRALRLWIPNHKRLPPILARKRGIVAMLAALVFVLYVLFARFGSAEKNWPTPPGLTPSRGTVIYTEDDLRRIWLWEVLSGHHPSRRKVPQELHMKTSPVNPALPPSKATNITLDASSTTGIGPERVYLDLQSLRPDVAYPPRPVAGSIADLDIILEHCDFSTGKYVRDCLEVLRIGGGLDSSNRLRRENLDDWRYIYVEKEAPQPVSHNPLQLAPSANSGKFEQLPLPPLATYRPTALLDSPCDPENPRIFHMFWGGPITDKPYTALMSFLYTQKTGLHTKSYPDDAPCRPQFWVWINQAPEAVLPPPNALRDMYSQLKENPWAAPFLHPRFKDIIKFKLWNTTEMLDGIPELKDDWRAMESLFKSGANVLHVSEPDQKATATNTAPPEGTAYNQLATIMSDMARFILCHRFGGIYLDADIVLLRDWEELFGWNGAFGYRWSWHDKYNTAVLRMSKGSALGTFLFRTALNNGLDFHPMTISQYTEQAYLQGLLFRIPDALFDPAFLNHEGYQRDRPPQPYFSDFSEFFATPPAKRAAPQAMGYTGFFSGAYCYHYHSPWIKPFDTSRNYPDLGPTFSKGEEALKAAVANRTQGVVYPEQPDLDWSTVLKRTFEAYVRGDGPNMYGEWIEW